MVAAVRHRRQPAGFHHAHLHAAAQDGRQPQHEAVYADAPCEVLHAQQDHVARTEGFAVVAHGLDAFLFFVQLLLQRLFLIGAQPAGLRRFVFRQHPPAERPDDRRNALDDEHFAPAEGVDQVT